MTLWTKTPETLNTFTGDVGGHVLTRSLDDIIGLDAGAVVITRGTVDDDPKPRVYAPESLTLATDDNGDALPDADARLIADARAAGWELLTDRSSQYRYHGPVMHASEYIGGALAADILATPGTYATAVVDVEPTPDDPEPELVGWVILYRPPVKHAAWHWNLTGTGAWRPTGADGVVTVRPAWDGGYRVTVSRAEVFGEDAFTGEPTYIYRLSHSHRFPEA